MEKYLEILEKCPLFYQIAPQDLLRMLNCLGARVLFFDKKYTVFAEGNSAKYIGILLSGSVQIIRNDFYGNRSLIQKVEVGELFGEDFACAEMEAMPLSAIADEPSEVLLVDCGHILHTCRNNCGWHQQLIFNLMKNLAVKSLAFHQKAEILSGRTTRDKLLSYLDLQSKKSRSSRFTIPFDRQELADYLEVDRSGLSAEISKLRKEGILNSRKNEFELL